MTSDTLGLRSGVLQCALPPRPGPARTPESPVTAKPRVALLALSLAAVLAGCPQQGANTTAGAPKTDAAPAKPKFTLDESKLTPAISFAMSDLDTSKNACSDFGGYVNGKWYAA